MIRARRHTDLLVLVADLDISVTVQCLLNRPESIGMQVLGWNGDYTSLRDWLASRRLWSPDLLKPSDPKQSLQAVLHSTRTPRSPNLYRRLAETVGVHRCADPAFNELKATLQQWFPGAGDE